MRAIRQILAWLWDWRPVPAWRVVQAKGAMAEQAIAHDREVSSLKGKHTKEMVEQRHNHERELEQAGRLVKRLSHLHWRERRDSLIGAVTVEFDPELFRGNLRWEREFIAERVARRVRGELLSGRWILPPEERKIPCVAQRPVSKGV